MDGGYRETGCRGLGCRETGCRGWGCRETGYKGWGCRGLGCKEKGLGCKEKGWGCRRRGRRWEGCKGRGRHWEGWGSMGMGCRRRETRLRCLHFPQSYQWCRWSRPAPVGDPARLRGDGGRIGSEKSDELRPLVIPVHDSRAIHLLRMLPSITAALEMPMAAKKSMAKQICNGRGGEGGWAEPKTLAPVVTDTECDCAQNKPII